MEQLQPQWNIEQPVVPNPFAAFLDRNGAGTLSQYHFLCDYLNKHTGLKYLTFQMAGAINQLIFTVGKMGHPPAIEMKLGESLGEKIDI